MIIVSQPSSIETTLNNSTQFNIQATKHAFDTLVSHQYRNKPQAIIRELMCNAADAHREAGTTLSIRVHLPTALEPHLTIQDFGTGISPEAMTTIYSSLFASTRNGSNEFTGGYGLGCKVPFAYSDTYAVSSRYNGSEYAYAMYRNPEGIPCFSLASITPTDIRNGLTVTIPVKQDDIDDFIMAADKILPWFDNVLCNQHFEIPEVIWETQHASIVKFTTQQATPIKVRLGNVLYDITNTEILWLQCVNKTMGQTTNYGYHYFGSRASCPNTSIIINMPMGSVTVTPNREDLVFDDATRETLKTAMEKTLESLKKHLDGLSYTTHVEATKALQPMYEILHVVRAWPQKVCVEGYEIDGTYPITFPEHWNLTTFSLKYRCRNNNHDIDKNRTISVSPDTQLVVVTGKCLKTMLKRELQVRTQTYMHMNGCHTRGLYVSNATQDEIATFLKPYITRQPITVTILPAPPKPKTPPITKSPLYDPDNKWFEPLYPTHKDFVYILTETNKFKETHDPDNVFATTNPKKVYDAVKELLRHAPYNDFETNTKIFLASKTHAKLLEEAPNAIDAREFAKEKVNHEWFDPFPYYQAAVTCALTDLHIRHIASIFIWKSNCETPRTMRLRELVGHEPCLDYTKYVDIAKTLRIELKPCLLASMIAETKELLDHYDPIIATMQPNANISTVLKYYDLGKSMEKRTNTHALATD